MAKGEGCDTPKGFPVSLVNGGAFIPNQIFGCRHILGAFVHEKIFPIGATILSLKLDKGRMLRDTATKHPPH